MCLPAKEYILKWYKHISDSLDDPFIFDLINQFGSDGYLVFFGVLEIYSREFKTEDNWKLDVTQSYLTVKLHKRQSTLVIKILKHIQNSGKWNVEFNDNQVIIFIPKFTELLDDWSQRKLRSNFGVTPKILNPIKIKDKRVKKNIIKADKISVAEKVYFTSEEIEKLQKEYGQELYEKSVMFLSSYKQEKDYKTKSDYLTIKRWVIDAVKKNNSKEEIVKI